MADYVIHLHDGSGNLVSTRTVTRDAAEVNDETIRQAAANALAGNRAYQALATPTAAQTTVQVRALTAQVNGLARLLLGLLDGTD